MKRRCVECGVAWDASVTCNKCLDQMERERRSTNLFPWPIARHGAYVAVVGVADKWDD